MITRQPQSASRRAALRSHAALASFRALSNHAFALVWGGQTLSRIGDFLYQIALAWWVLDQTGSAGAMATMLIVSLVPTLLLLLWGGVVVDRRSRIHVMLVSDLVRGGVVSLVAVLAWLDLLQLWHLYALNLLFGVVDAFFQPAYAAAVPELVSDDDLSSANALSSMSVHLGRIGGPAIAATVVAFGGEALAFALNGLTFLVAAVMLVPLLRPSAARHTDERPRTNTLVELREGVSIVFKTPWLWITVLICAASNVTLGSPFAVALPFLVRDHLRAEVGTLSLLYVMFAIGYVGSGLWLGRRVLLRQRGPLIYGGLTLAGLALHVFGLPMPLGVLFVAAVVNGAALEAASLAWTSAMQHLVPREKLGRVASVDALGSFALIPLGYAIAGWATDVVGAQLVFAVGGGVTAVVALLVLLTNAAVRDLN